LLKFALRYRGLTDKAKVTLHVVPQPTSLYSRNYAAFNRYEINHRLSGVNCVILIGLYGCYKLIGRRVRQTSCKTPYFSVYEIPVTGIDGLNRSMAEFRSQVRLVVNVVTQ
jgi:hypothetical protein